jgi:hypothetical protein
MTRGRWVAVLLLLAIAGGVYYAHDAGHIDQGRRDYAAWAEARRVSSDGREARNEKPTLLDLALDKVARWVPGR